MNSKSIKSKEKTAIFIAILAAALYALNSPLSFWVALVIMAAGTYMASTE